VPTSRRIRLLAAVPGFGVVAFVQAKGLKSAGSERL
jgi:hypothetical protein